MSPSPRPVKKAVIPAAGFGTRFLPATKAQPKEMLPVVDKPVIQFAVEECAASGIAHVIIVTGRGKSAIEDHFDAAPELEEFLERKGKREQVERLREIAIRVRISYTRQAEQLGLGHAVLQAQPLVGDEPFAVLLPDVIMAGTPPATRQLIDAYEATGEGAITVVPVPREQTSLYGIVSVDADEVRGGRTVARIRDLVEKPSPAQAPSTLAVVGRYLLPPEIFSALERTTPGSGGEIQLTDGLRRLAKERRLWACAWGGKSYDAGDKLGFLQATVELALENPELGPAFRAWLRQLKF